jgi:hypothetical protein
MNVTLWHIDCFLLRMVIIADLVLFFLYCCVKKQRYPHMPAFLNVKRRCFII